MEKYKKIDREFPLTDSTVNTYGFRLLTSGYLMDEYKKNPIGYHMHARKEGVIVKWEDLHVKDDVVYGKPVINMSHPRAQQTVDEIENGFLNAASVGHLVVLAYTDDPAMKLEGQTGPTVTKWFNRECSLVDIPGNMNSVSLFDQFENPIQLADFTNTKLQKPMKQIFITAAQLGQLNLKADDADDAKFANAFNDLVAKAAKAEGLQTQLNDLQAKQTDLQSKYDALQNQDCSQKVTEIISTALAAKKITVQLGDKLKADYAKNPDGLKNLIDAMPAYQSLTDKLKEEGKKLEDELLSKGWDELYESGRIADLKAQHPEVYKQKFKEAFGTEPTN